MTSGRHLLGLIDDVLDISRIEAGNLSFSPEPIPLAESVSRAIQIVTPMAASSGIQIVYDTALSCQQHVMADRQRLQQVLLNLLSNAVKYNRKQGEVRITCGTAPVNRVRIRVSDMGPGISAEDQRRLFVPFERLGAAQSEVEGTGLGLALSKRLIESMGGTIGLESVVGSGSTFWIELPGAVSPLAKLGFQAGLTAPPAHGPAGAHTVLYVEDNVANLRLMEHILTYRPQVKLLAAMQGRLGLDLAFQHQPELIFLDLHLPDIGGDAVLRQLRADSRTRGIPTVVISADATAGQIARLSDMGATGYLTKPFDVEKLLRILDECLSGNLMTETAESVERLGPRGVRP